MPGEVIRSGFPAVAASAVRAEEVVTLGGNKQRSVVPVPTAGIATAPLPVGIALTAASPGEPVTVRDQGNYVEVTAAASLGAGAELNVATTSGALGPVTTGKSVGQAVEAAGAGERFTFYVNPRAL